MGSNGEETHLLASEEGSFENIRISKTNYYIEPVIFLTTFTGVLSIQFIPNLLLKQTCLSNGYNSTDCSNLNSNERTKDIEDRIQPEVAQILMILVVLDAVLSGIASLFLLSWSDKYGRKPVICASVLGQAATFASFSFFATLTDHNYIFSPWMYILSAIPYAMTGAAHTFQVSALCYITDRSHEASRSTRFVIIEILTFSGVLLGHGLCSFDVIVALSSKVITVTCMSAIICAVYAKCVIPENNALAAAAGLEKLLRDLFSLDVVSGVVKTCFKRRPGKSHIVLWCLFGLLALFFISKHGTSIILYLFLRKQFSWTLQDASVYQTASSIASILGCFVGIFLLKNVFGLKDITLAVIAITCAFADSFVFLTSQITWPLYAALAVFSLKALMPVMYRSIISAHAQNDEIGKIFSFTNLLESASSFLAAPLYTFVYTRTFSNFPAAFFLISSGCSIISLFVIYVVAKDKKH